MSICKTLLIGAIVLPSNFITSDGFSVVTRQAQIILHHDGPATSLAHPKRTVAAAAKGFGDGDGGGGGGGGFGGNPRSSSSSSSGTKNKKVKKSDLLKKTQQRLLKTYGTDIAQGTQKRVEQAMQALPPHLYMATQLYQQLQRWNVRLEKMSILQQAQIPAQEMEGAQRAQDELQRLYQEYGFDEHDLHNIFQKITWDASADAKAARAMTGEMPADIQAKVDKVCHIAASAVLARQNDDGKCLDIGCGHGVLVPHLIQCGLRPSQICGIDLSPEMIRNAREQHPRGVHFEAVDFINDYNPKNDNENDNKNSNDDDELFDAVIFCSSLHDFSNLVAALKKAAALVRPRGGKLIISHPQGASHVLRQSAANPVMVKRGLPSADELRSMLTDVLDGMTLEMEPAKANSPQEAQEGYLAVLRKD